MDYARGDVSSSSTLSFTNTVSTLSQQSIRFGPVKLRPKKEGELVLASSAWHDSCSLVSPNSMGNTNSVASTSQRQIPNIKFRVLIIGRANAGKTTILQRVCDTTDSPVVYRGDEEVRPLTFVTHRSIQSYSLTDST